MPKEENRLGITPEDALLGQLYYVFLHETGHAMFDLLNASVFGNEESAADQFATYMMLQMGKNDARQMIMGATFTFKSFIDKPEITTPTANFSDIHGTPAQRFFNLLCIGYGARLDVFGEVVDQGLLPQGRAQDCAFEYGALAWAFKTQIAPHMDEQLAQKVLDRSWIPDVTARPKRPSHATNIEK